MPRRRLTAGRKLDVLEMWELVFAWGGQCVQPLLHRFVGCNGIGCWSKFESDEERRIAWFANRDELIHAINPGYRPPAFWYYEAPTVCTHRPRCPMPAYEDREKWLAKHDLLTPRELADFRRKGSDHE